MYDSGWFVISGSVHIEKRANENEPYLKQKLF